MVFLTPHALWLLLLFPIVVLLIVQTTRARQHHIEQIGDSHLVDDLLITTNGRARWVKVSLWSVAFICTIMAVARPAWGIAEDLIEAEGIAIIVVLDVSASMDAQDIAPSRLERAKLSAREIYQNGAGNQLGLVLFAGSAFAQMPLTTDAQAAITFLNAASTRSISRQGTALEDALQLAIDTIDDRIVSNSVVIVLSDGENHEGDPRNAANLAAARGIIVHTIGYGDTVNGSPIPIDTTNPIADPYKTDGQGNLVLTKLEEAVLRDVASITGGTYQRASNSGIETVNLLNEIETIEAGVLSNQLQIRRIERFGIFVLLALIALTIEIFLPESVDNVS